MKTNIFEEIKMMQKLMLYDRGKTTSENVQLHENIISTPPDAGGGGGGGNRGGGGGGRRGGGGAPPKPIPIELKDVEGVRKFQDWLDTNKAGWAYGYTDGKVSQGKGWGRFGPRTQAAWAKHKDEFMKTGSFSDPFAAYSFVEGGDGPTTPGSVEGADDLSAYKVEDGGTTTPTTANATNVTNAAPNAKVETDTAPTNTTPSVTPTNTTPSVANGDIPATIEDVTQYKAEK